MKFPALFVLLLFSPLLLEAQYPQIQDTRVYTDSLFKQQQEETESWYFNAANGKATPPLSLYRYKSRSDDSLIMLSATFSLPVDTLATINGFENMADFRAGQELLVPSAPGLYLYSEADSSWMRQLRTSLEDTGQEPVRLVLMKDGLKKNVAYYQGMNLPGDLKSRFVLPLFYSPLEKRTITSPFGYRNHPVTGQWGLHVGCDYRASTGTAVFACADGWILSTGMVEDYGKYVIIQHRNGYTSLYGHLSRIVVEKNQTIFEGMKIAETGNTGISTGPHLHFEIRQNGNAVDPENLLLKDTE